MIDTQDTNASICFWSGTGNSYRVAHWIGEIAQNQGVKTRVVPIDKASLEGSASGKEGDFMALVFPTHGFTAPWHVLKSVWRLPQGESRPAYCVATRAGLKFGPLFLPGISGSATFIIALMLLLKGYKVGGVMSVDMPSNWYSLHPIQARKKHDSIIEKAERKIYGFMERVHARSPIWFTLNNLYEIIWSVLLSLISVVYLFFGRFFLAKLFFANNNCDGCGICAQYCSVRAITIRGNDRKTPYWKFTCESCMKCAALCPRNAIEAGHSWGVILYFITALPASAYLLSFFGMDLTDNGKQDVVWLYQVFDIFYYFSALFLSYFLFHLLIKIHWVNSFFTYTTMTRLPFWGRYREPKSKLRDLNR